MDHSIKSVERLQKMTQVPVLVVMPLIRNGEEKEKGDGVRTGLKRSKAVLLDFWGGIRKRIGKE
jgi:hypothetical protein